MRDLTRARRAPENKPPTTREDAGDPIYLTVGEYAGGRGMSPSASTVRALTRRAKALCRRRAIPVLPVSETRSQEWWAFPPEVLAELFQPGGSDHRHHTRRTGAEA